MTHEQRVHHHMYETLEGIAEQSERIARLEELVADMDQEIGNLWGVMTGCVHQRRSPNAKELVTADMRHTELIRRMRELGVEVDS